MTTLADIFGQDSAVNWLSQAYAENRLPHGLIFAGPAGVGKATTARALAAVFLCEKPKSAHPPTPCGKCPSCTIFATDNHPDLHVIYKELIRLTKPDSVAKDLAVDVMRDYLLVPAARKPNMGRGKVFIIEQADLMNPQAQNACLKTLEEPEGRKLIILLTDQVNSLLPTIRSRCQAINFGCLPEPLVRKELEKRGLNKTDAADAAAFTDGSLGVALRWHEEGIIPHARELRKRIDALIAGKGAQDLPEWLKAAADDYVERQIKRDKATSKTQANRDALMIYFRLAAQRFRSHLAEADDPDQLEHTCAAIDALARSEQFLESNVNIPLIFQQLAVTLDRLFVRALHSARQGSQPR
jgi:DNA polymerase-3 subunit delta'